jgi:hypothetical protein
MANLNELKSTYRVRATILANRDPGPTYPSTLAADVAALADGLEAADEQPVHMWHIALPDWTDYIIFELAHARALAGVVKSADHRVVNPRQWPWEPPPSR